MKEFTKNVCRCRKGTITSISVNCTQAVNYRINSHIKVYPRVDYCTLSLDISFTLLLYEKSPIFSIANSHIFNCF